MRFFPATAFIFLFIFIFSVFAQENKVLLQIEDEIISLRLNQGDVLFEKKFFDLKKMFDDLRETAGGRQLTTTEQNDAEQLHTEFRELSQRAEKAKPVFSSALAARDEALSYDAQDYAPELYAEAEAQLHELAEEVKVDETFDHEKKLDQVTRQFRQAQFESIRNKLLSQVRINIQESRDMNAEKLAPQTYRKVMDLMETVENILEKNRFNDPGLQEKAAQLQNESQHLLYLVQLANKVDRNESAFEDYILQLENSVVGLAALLNYQPDFDYGIQPVVKDLELSLEDLKKENESLREINGRLIDSLQSLGHRNRMLKSQMNRNAGIENKIENLKLKLQNTGISISRNSDELMLRMNGLQFEAGQTSISGYDADLLRKVGEALRIFPTSVVEIRIIQPASGNYEYNKTLAGQRAKNAALVIQSAGFISDERLTASGVVLNSETPGEDALLEIELNSLSDNQYY